MLKIIPVFILAALALAGCASTSISGPGVAAPGTVASPPAVALPAAVQTDLAAAVTDMNNAVTAGVVPASDPLLACLNSAVAQTSGGTPQVTETLTNAGAISGATIAYIKAQQLEAILKAAKGLTVSPQCEQLIGHAVVLANQAGLQIGGQAALFGILK